MGSLIESTTSTLPGAAGDPFFGGAQSHAALEGAKIQAALGEEAVDLQRQSLEQIRADLSPFVELGVTGAPLLGAAVDDPSRILRNPFFRAQAEQLEQQTLAQQAARGKLGSGETQNLLTRGILGLGSQFQQQDIGNLSNLVKLGQASAAQVGAQTGNVAAAQGGIIGRQGEALASGQIGAGNAKAQGIENAVGLGATAATAFGNRGRVA
jgi:hypothetical protein